MSELRLVHLNGRRFYEIDFFQQFEDEKEALRVFKNEIYPKAKRVQAHFPEVSFFIGLSNTEADNTIKNKTTTCVKITEQTGKRGRPKTVILGKKVPYHIHIISTGKNVTKANERLQQAINKQHPVKVTKSKCLKGADFIHYLDRQSEYTREIGDFDFSVFKSNQVVGI